MTYRREVFTPNRAAGAERKGLEIEKGAFRLCEMEPVWV